MNATRRAVLWQVFGGIVAFVVIAAAIGELLWWSLYIGDRTNITRTWTAIVHATAGLATILLILYRSRKKHRDDAFAQVRSGEWIREPEVTFHVGPFPIEVQASFVFAAVFYGYRGNDWVRTAAFALFAMIAVLLHELGHAIVARRELRGDVHILLHLTGGLTTFDSGGMTRRQHVLIALAGPLAGALTGVAILAIAIRFPAAWHNGLYRDALFVTLGWSALNLVPIWPLDGATAFDVSHRWSAAIALVAGGCCLYFDEIRLGLLFIVLFVINVFAIERVRSILNKWNRRIG